MAYMVLALCLAVLIALFAVQNSGSVVISFLFWRVEASLAVVVFLSVFAGMLLAATIVLSRYVKQFSRSAVKKQ